MKRVVIVICFFAVFFAAFSLFAFPLEQSVWQIFEIGTYGVAADADDAAVHDPYFSAKTGGRILNLKRGPHLRFHFDLVPSVTCFSLPERTVELTVYSHHFYFSELILSAVLPARAGPFCI